jgi:hypothetical protein
VAITAGVVLGLALLWWAFDAAPPGSRRARFDRWTRLRGQRNLARGWRRPSFIAFAVMQLVVLVALIWLAVVAR